MGGILTQFFPPSPTFTEKNLPSLRGKVIIITGGNAGVGLSLAKILYAAGATIYIAARSVSRIDAAIQEIKSLPNIANRGVVKKLIVDFSDLRTVQPAASEFLAQETRLDVLFNNAGISHQPVGSVGAQGHEIHIATNCLGPFLFTKLLLPLLARTAAKSPANSVRVVWTTSGFVEISGPPGGLDIEEIEAGGNKKDPDWNYSASKSGNWFISSELSKRVKAQGIVSVVQNPGTLGTKGWDNLHWIVRLMVRPLLHDPKMGAYTELWSGFNEQVTVEEGGKMAIPWGRWHPGPVQRLLDSLKTKKEGGTGLAEEFWDWCEERTREFAGTEK